MKHNAAISVRKRCSFSKRHETQSVDQQSEFKHRFDAHTRALVCSMHDS